MLITLITQVAIPIVIMIGGLLGLKKSQRKGGLIVVGAMMLVAFGVVVPALAIYSHVNRPKWCQQAYETDARAATRPHDAFMSACTRASYEAIHCMLADYAKDHGSACEKRRTEVAAILRAQ